MIGRFHFLCLNVVQNGSYYIHWHPISVAKGALRPHNRIDYVKMNKFKSVSMFTKIVFFTFHANVYIRIFAVVSI